MCDEPAYAKADHIYFYHISKNDGAICYERSFPRNDSGVAGAISRVKELEKRGVESFFCIGKPFPLAFY